MDALRFDALVRSLDLRAPRRAAPGALGGGLTTLFVRLGSDDAAAKKKHKKHKKKKRCPAGTKACAGACFPSAACCPPCTAGQTCLGSGRCAIACAAPADCPAGCSCGPGVSEDFCIPAPPPCATFLQLCSSDAACPPGQACFLMVCPGIPGNPGRCLPFCTG